MQAEKSDSQTTSIDNTYPTRFYFLFANADTSLLHTAVPWTRAPGPAASTHHALMCRCKKHVHELPRQLCLCIRPMIGFLHSDSLTCASHPTLWTSQKQTCLHTCTCESKTQHPPPKKPGSSPSEVYEEKNAPVVIT